MAATPVVTHQVDRLATGLELADEPGGVVVGGCPETVGNRGAEARRRQRLDTSDAQYLDQRLPMAAVSGLP